MNIVQQAKSIIYNSSIMQYIPQDKIEEAFSHIYVYDNKEDFLREYGRDDFDKNDRLEGFNRSKGSYLGPDATVHTVIHEVLHGISSKFDEQGHRIENGIQGNYNLQFAGQVNEGITDYLSVKLSGEKPRHYIQGHKLFSMLEPMMAEYTKNPDILMQIYLNKDVNFIHDFLNYFGKENTFEQLYGKFLFMRDNELENMMQGVKKGLHKYTKKRERKEKINNLGNKIKELFSRNKVKLLEQPTNANTYEVNSHSKFIHEYNINNFQSNITKEDEAYYEQYQQQQNNGINRDDDNYTRES